MGTNTIFSQRIKELRESLGLSQTEFAKSVGTTQTTLSAYETLERTPSLDIVKSISETYYISIDWLLGLSNIKNVDNTPDSMGDILKMLFTLNDYCDITIYDHTEDILDFDASDGTPIRLGERTTYEIGFNSDIMNNYIAEWRKMHLLYQAGTIDYEVYSLWIEKTIKKANRYTIHGDYVPEGFVTS